MSESQFVITLPQSRSLTKPERARALIFDDPKSQALLDRLRLIAPSNASVMIVGETGTGKELVARHIHELSGRATGPFLAVNCGAFSEQLVESELFGHERGAFTGAITARQGWFEAANGGTIFLDEIGDLPLPLQVKLLRVLQERSVTRIGSRKSVDINVRVISATNLNLEEAVATGRFRQDLYYRLNVAKVRLAPLRERRGDIPALVQHFMKVYSAQLGLGVKGLKSGPGAGQLSREAEQELYLRYHWPGNIRELENVVHHALLVSDNRPIRVEDLNLVEPPPLPKAVVRAFPAAESPDDFETDYPFSLEERLRRVLLEMFEKNSAGCYDAVEKSLVQTAYAFCDRNQVETARLLGITRNVLRARLMKCGDLTPDQRFRARAELLEAV